MKYSIKAEYIWIDGSKPTKKLRSKTKIIHSCYHKNDVWCDIGSSLLVNDMFIYEYIKLWAFDASSTYQAPFPPVSSRLSDRILNPVRVIFDPLCEDGILVLCEVLDIDGRPHETNTRSVVAQLEKDYGVHRCLFGIEQEYTLFEGSRPLGWPDKGFPPPQGPFYCGVGADEVFGRPLIKRHLDSCIKAGLNISGANAEVMPGQWEFQIGPSSAINVSDEIWLARYILYRLGECRGITIRLDPKPVVGEWNGAGAHINFSTSDMRDDGGLEDCHKACRRLGHAATGIPVADILMDNSPNEEHIYDAPNFPKQYGYGYERRLIGACETCSYNQFKYGIGDRTASVRIPLYVEQNGKGYIEDRRPCANIDPYEAVAYLIKTICTK